MPYTAEKPKNARSSEDLRRAIPGWGVDLDVANRPGVPKEQFDPEATGAHWHTPDWQEAHYPRERSTEHKYLTPVFGTVCPPRGVSGMLRRFAYENYSEGQTAHWVLLILADRIDVLESKVTGALAGRPDFILTESGIKSEITRHGVRSRVGRHRADVAHQGIDVLRVLLGAAALTAATVYAVDHAGRAMRRSNTLRRALRAA